MTAGQLCHLLQVQSVSHSSQRQIHIHVHRIVLFVVVEDAVLAQSTHSQSCTLRDSPLSSFRGTGTINVFLKEEEQSQMGQKGD